MAEMKCMRMITKGLAGIENQTMNKKGAVLWECNNGSQTYANMDQNRCLTSYTETKFIFLDFS